MFVFFLLILGGSAILTFWLNIKVSDLARDYFRHRYTVKELSKATGKSYKESNKLLKKSKKHAATKGVSS
jgi:hypothetical protein